MDIDYHSKLVGVEVVDELITNGGRTYYKFIHPINQRTYSTLGSGFSKSLKMNGLSKLDLILKLNNISLDDLPKCKICGKRHVSLGDRRWDKINIINPVVSDVCSHKSCRKSDSSSKSNSTKTNKGIHPFQTRSMESKSASATKANLTRLKRGNHISQVGGHHEYDGHHFSSKSEVRVYKRYRRFLNKYYNREKSISSYSIGDVSKQYIADYVLKSEYSHLDLPDVIEIKGGTLFSGRLKNEKEVNYSKFLSVLNSGKTLLIIDDFYLRSPPYNHYCNKIFIDSLDKLNKVFM